MIHFAIGTRAQLIKTAPVMKRLSERGIVYRYIDLGQHPATSARLRTLFGLREPDFALASPSAATIASVSEAARWAARILSHTLRSRQQVLQRIFGGSSGVCVIHGDTLSTVLGLLLAKRAGLKVCHLEAGLRSHNLLHPFPEELFRLFCMRYADHLAAPAAWAAENLQAMGYEAKTWLLPGNTGAEAVTDMLRRFPIPQQKEDSFVLVSIHRFETIMSRRRLRALVQCIAEIATQKPVRFIVHEPTRRRLQRYGLRAILQANRVLLIPSLDYPDFLRLLQTADCVVTDGGSVQEECAYMGTPCVLFRRRTERQDGLGENVCLSGMEPATLRTFISDAAYYRRPPTNLHERPSDVVIDKLVSSGYVQT